jgi:hypothetical protein
MAVSAVRPSVIFPDEHGSAGVCVDVKSTFTLDRTEPVEEAPWVGPIGPLCGGNGNERRGRRERDLDPGQTEDHSEVRKAVPCIVIWP